MDNSLLFLGAAKLVQVWDERLVEWVHLSHPNILPLYAALLEGEELLYLVSPSTSNADLRDHVKNLTIDQRVALVRALTRTISPLLNAWCRSRK